MTHLSRREIISAGLSSPLGFPETVNSLSPQDLQNSPFTGADSFVDVSRGNPVPHSLSGEALRKAKLTTDTWKLEITGTGGAKLRQELTLDNGKALDYNALFDLAKSRSVRYVKAIQCLNIPRPLGQGLWEGIPLRDILQLVGPWQNVRRAYYYGFHNNDPAQLFQSSLSMTEILETPPGDLPAFLAIQLNGEPIPLKRGGPVRMIVPWAHGFKSIKWLQNIVLTNDFHANDTYADANNDPESHLKSAAYFSNNASTYTSKSNVVLTGVVISGLSQIMGVEGSLISTNKMSGETDAGKNLGIDHNWIPVKIDPPPANWSHILPNGVDPKTLLGFNSRTGQPKDWPTRYGMATWTANLGRLLPGNYEFRVRSIDKNGIRQPYPRPERQTGLNAVEVFKFTVNS